MGLGDFPHQGPKHHERSSSTFAKALKQFDMLPAGGGASSSLKKDASQKKAWPANLHELQCLLGTAFGTCTV